MYDIFYVRFLGNRFLINHQRLGSELSLQIGSAEIEKSIQSAFYEQTPGERSQRSEWHGVVDLIYHGNTLVCLCETMQVVP